MQDLQSIKLRFGIIGNSPALNRAIEIASQVAPTDMSVLITGESGTGKESFSKIIHQLSARKHSPFIAVNCGAIPEGTISSELFGHEKGAFTGSTTTRKGYFEEVDGGTIFLDEIGELPSDTQSMLLRLLENGEYIKVGSSKVQKVNVRVVAATNVKLLSAVAKGDFREDLFYRLNTVPISVPSLRDRGNDSHLLFLKFSSDFSEKYRVKPLSLSLEAKNVLSKYSFKGNIRELRNIVERMSVLELDRYIEEEVMLSYFPLKPEDSSSNLPTIYTGNESKGDLMNSNDILYKYLIELKSEVSELKTIVLSLLKSNANPEVVAHILKNSQHLFADTIQSPDVAVNPLLLESDRPMNTAVNSPVLDIETNSIHINTSPSSTFSEAHSVEEVDFDESISSLEEMEKEWIIKALKKNNNKRKYAAQDLGISERTLYRKIKQYELDDL